MSSIAPFRVTRDSTVPEATPALAVRDRFSRAGRLFASLLPFALVLVLIFAASGQLSAQTIDLAHFGLGPIAPFSLELDGDPATPEFGAVTPLGLWVINPATYCRSLVTTPLGFEEATAAGTFYIATVQRIAGRDHVVYIDVDPSDGRLPIVAQKIESECYPSSRASTSP